MGCNKEGMIIAICWDSTTLEEEVHSIAIHLIWEMILFESFSIRTIGMDNFRKETLEITLQIRIIFL